MAASALRASIRVLAVLALLVGASRPSDAATPAALEPGVEDERAAGGELASAPLATRWRIPPIGYWGSLTYDYRLDRADQQARTTEHLVTTTVNAASFLWQPWFAVVSGGLGVTVGRIGVDGAESPTSDRFVTGNAQLNLFPRSRFPFEARLEIGDSRIDSGVSPAVDYRSTRFGMTQRYRPPDGAYALSGSYDHATQTGRESGQRDTADALGIEYESHAVGRSLNVTAIANRTHREASREDDEFDSLVARHSYRPDTSLSVESTGNLTRRKYDLLGGGSETREFQVSSVAFWRPEGRPYTGVAAVRLVALQVPNGGGEAQSATATVGGTYMVSSNFNTFASLSVSTNNPSAGSGIAHSESLGTTYQGDTIAVGRQSYDWSVSATASDSGGAGNTSQAVSGQFVHTLSRGFSLPDDSTISVSVGQNLGGGVASGVRDATEGGSRSALQLGHSASVTWAKTGGQGTAYARLNGSDTRQVYGEERPVFQLANLQVSGTWNFGRYSSLAGDLTLQYTRQDSGFLRLTNSASVLTSPSQTTTTTASADLTYRHQRFLNVPRLRFTSQLRVVDDSYAQRDSARPSLDRETRYWDNRVEYLIGRLLASLSLRVSEIDRQRHTVVMLRVRRDFGGEAMRW